MYFWNLKKLKAELAGPGLSDRRNLPYFVLVLVAVATTFAPVPRHNFWSGIYAVIAYGSIICGALLCYRRNGGASGQQFVSRFSALTCVCAIRWSLLFVVPATLTAVLIPGTPWVIVWPWDPYRPPIGRADLIMLAFVYLPLFWRVSLHIRDVARATPQMPRAEGVVPEAPILGKYGLEPLED